MPRCFQRSWSLPQQIYQRVAIRGLNTELSLFNNYTKRGPTRTRAGMPCVRCTNAAGVACPRKSESQGPNRPRCLTRRNHLKGRLNNTARSTNQKHMRLSVWGGSPKRGFEGTRGLGLIQNFIIHAKSGNLKPQQQQRSFGEARIYLPKVLVEVHGSHPGRCVRFGVIHLKILFVGDNVRGVIGGARIMMVTRFCRAVDDR